MKEADLYPDLKAYLEGQGYTVKAEIGACDLMARRGDEPAVVVEMKLSFYLAVPVAEKGWKLRYKDIIALCRRLGLGLLAVKPGLVEAHLDPAPYTPRKSTVRAGRLLREFDRRVGDPNVGGTTGVKRMTAYRQDALRCLVALQGGALKASEVAKASGVARAAALMRDDHYGWFERQSVGIYALTSKGQTAMLDHGDEIARLGAEDGA